MATAAAPCSSISAPVVKRSSANGTFSGCGSPWAIVHANVEPGARVALNPPVPQPQFTNRPSTGVRPTIGEASGQTSTIPAHVRSTRACANTGNSSSAAASWCSITWNEPRWA